MPVDVPETEDYALIAVSDDDLAKLRAEVNPDPQAHHRDALHSLTLQRRSQPPDLSPRLCSSLLPPRAMLLSEQLFVNVASYFTGMLRNISWITDELGFYTVKVSGIYVNDLDSFFAHCMTAGMFFVHVPGSFSKPGQVLSKACVLIQHIIRT